MHEYFVYVWGFYIQKLIPQLVITNKVCIYVYLKFYMQISHISEIMKQYSFYVQLISLNMIYSMIVHVVVEHKSHSFLGLNDIPLYTIPVSLPICKLMNTQITFYPGYLNDATVSKGMKISLRSGNLSYLEYMPKSRITRSYGINV